MGVYINGMGMPEYGETVTITICADGLVFEEFKEPGNVFHAVPVPPHGRLIDADALTSKIFEECDKFQAINQYDSGLWAGYRASAKAVRLAPTIIPAEEGE